ncbi:MAG: formate dehydrogenase accessory protein FdhE [Ignavibacteriaceae bacterium]|nr:formate dehydrogenase accessory protein FdhE [Ignavibacteriaceae bacterium]
MSIKTLGQIKKGIEELKRQEQFEDSSLVDLEKLLRFELDFKRKMKKKIDISSVFAKNIKEKLENGEHIADFSNIKIDKKWILDGFRNICNIRRLCDSELEKAIENGDFDLLRLQKNLIIGDTFSFKIPSDKFGIDSEILYSIALGIFKPIFELCAEGTKGLFNDYKWKYGRCPFCGTYPRMAKFEKEVGKRKLWCPLCSTEWVYGRAKCPFCENDNQQLLRFFSVEDNSPYRVDACDECKGYIKTVDERKKSIYCTPKTGIKPYVEEITIFEIEDIKTFYLDNIAQNEGYKKLAKI